MGNDGRMEGQERTGEEPRDKGGSNVRGRQKDGGGMGARGVQGGRTEGRKE